jgi:glutathione S-transferase
VFDRQLGQTRYLVGDSATAADLFLAPIAFFLPGIPGLKEIAEAAPNLDRWIRDMAGRASMKATEPEPIAAVAA